MGITIRPPDIQRSETGFTVKEGEIWYGLGAVKGLGGKLVDALVECRDGSRANGAAAQRRALFRSIYDLCERADTQALNKTVLESLIACGALDSFGQRRSQLAAVLENALARGAQARKDKKAGQATFFELFGDPGAGGNGGEAEVYPDLDEWSESERLSREKKTLGFYLSGHPLERWDGVIRQFGTYTLADIPSLADGTAVMVGVEITKITKKVSKRTGEPFWLTLVEDRTSTLEVFIGKGQYEEAREVFHEESIVFLKGSVRYRDTTASLRIERMLAVAQATSQLTEDLTVVLPLGDGTGTEDLLFRLKGLLQAHRGTCPVYLVFRGQAAERAIVRVGAENYVTPDLPLFEEIQRLCGRGHVLLNRMRRQRA
jgi:DNA polymerase-3 subunit alpha